LLERLAKDLTIGAATTALGIYSGTAVSCTKTL